MAEVLLNQEQIKEIIPHRDPFLLIDEVLEMEVGKRVVARKYIKADDFWFKGHFPEKPVTPGVLMIEMLAQAGAVCILSQPEFKGKIALFAGIDKAKFRGAGRCAGSGSRDHRTAWSGGRGQGDCQRRGQACRDL
jgi:3-hydroxyacyl-[acyl-carrier-protein] dehydratase